MDDNPSPLLVTLGVDALLIPTTTTTKKSTPCSFLFFSLFSFLERKLSIFEKTRCVLLSASSVLTSLLFYPVLFVPPFSFPLFFYSGTRT